LAIYIILAISMESIYRQPLFDKSVNWEKSFQNNSTAGEKSFFKVITNFGTEPVLIPMLIILFFWYPLNKSYMFVSVMSFSIYIDCIFKIIYGNPRPFWLDTSISLACDGGFGNPSGHSFSSSACYLSFWHILTDIKYFENKKIFRGITLIFAVLMFLTIMLSRVFLGVHSVNQVIYGCSLGVALYFFYFFIHELHQYSAKNFFRHFLNIKYILFYSVKYTICIILALLVYYCKKNDSSSYDSSLYAACPTLQEYRKFNNDGLYGMLTLFTLIGAYYGLLLAITLSTRNYPGKEEEINSWNSTQFCKQIYKILFSILFVCPIILSQIISGNSTLIVIFIFKVTVPYLFGLFGLFGLAIHVIIITKNANEAIYEEAKSSVEFNIVNNTNSKNKMAENSIV